MRKIFYEKVGRKYVPVSEYNSELTQAYPKGTHIIMSYPGGSSTRYNIDPNYAAMIAAGRVAEDAISSAVVKASELRPHNQPVTEEQRKAWDELANAFGDERYYVEIPSAREIAEAGVKAMQLEAKKLMQHESVRLAYEQFMLVCELTKENKNADA
jgi:hypothetical protein